MSAPEEARVASRARFALNESGAPFCTEHSYELSPTDWGCQQCYERDRRNQEIAYRRQRRIDEVHHWLGSCVRDVDGLGGLPAWPFAHFDNQRWLERCNPAIVTAVRPWDFKSWLWVGAKTGDGKSSTIRAKYLDAHDRLIVSAERGPVELPPLTVYCTGCDLAEAEKRRHFDERHALIHAVLTRSVAIIDEIMRAPVELVFEIVDARYRAGLTTVACAGASAKDFGALFGANVLRRFFDAGKVVDRFPKTGSK